jgi:hypothetical protein
MRILFVLLSMAITQAATQDPARPAGVRVSGRVVGALVESAERNVALQLRDVPGAPMIKAPFGTDGVFGFAAVAPGSYDFRLASPPTVILRIEVADRDVEGLVLMTIDPRLIPPSPLVVAGLRTPVQPAAGMAVVSVSQSESYPSGWREGGLHYFRIEQSGKSIEELTLQGKPLEFALAAGNYVLAGKSRACDGSCIRLGPPEIQCSIPLNLTANQAVYVERVVRDTACSFRINAAP